MQTAVNVISKNGKRLMPTFRFGKVRHMLKSGQAVIVKHEPFTIQYNNVIVAVDDEEAIAYSEILERNGINTVVVDDSQSYFDYLLDDGIRICTYTRLGCLVFENVIIPDTYDDLLDPNVDSGLEIPDRYWYFDWIERLAYKMMLFGHAVAASRKTTYLFDPRDDSSLVQLYRENVH